MSAGSLLIAIGNPLRRDDGLARRVLELLGPLPGVDVHEVLQLTPELADDISKAASVVFIDADVEPGEPRLEPLQPVPQSASPLGHAMTPEEVVSIARRLYGFSGRAHLCRIPGFDFSEGESLSPEAEANAQVAARMLRLFTRNIK